jgi:hypothetical protein
MRSYSWAQLAALVVLYAQVVHDASKGSSLSNTDQENSVYKRYLKPAAKSLVPQVQNVLECAPGVSQWYYKYTFEDSCILEGYSVGSIVTRTYCDGIKVMTLVISCATRYVNGVSPSPAYGPTEEKDAKIIDYSIKRCNRMNANANNTVLGSHVTTTVAASCTTCATHSIRMTTKQQINSQQTTVVSQVDIECNAEKHNW